MPLSSRLRQMPPSRFLAGQTILLLTLWFFATSAYAQEDFADVLDIFENSCAFSGCHSGSASPKGLDLSEDFAASSLVGKPSSERPNVLRVKPGDPVNSYLIMKLRGSGDIDGDRMPKGGQPLSDFEIGVIESWIRSLPPAMKVEAPKPEYAEAFPGISLATLPTTQTIESGMFSYRIAHRWRGEARLF